MNWALDAERSTRGAPVGNRANSGKGRAMSKKLAAILLAATMISVPVAIILIVGSGGAVAATAEKAKKAKSQKEEAKMKAVPAK
jgi:hypothetical protein